MTRKGGLDDPVAQNIRNEQNRDAMPTKEEIEAEARRDEQIHAEWKAVEVLLDRIDAPKTAEVTGLVAKHLGYDRLANRALSYRGFDNTGGPGFQTRHEEAWEKPDTDDLPRQAQMRQHPPFDARHDMDRVRRLKQEAFLRLHRIDFDDFEIASKRIAPMGNNAAAAVRYDGELLTNETWDKVFGDDAWRDRFDEETKEKYRNRLRDALADA